MSERIAAAPSSADIELATVELLGALAYGQLRSFGLTAHAVGLAPDVRSADALATIAIAEHAAYERLRDHLAGRTELAFGAMERQKATFDAFFDRAEPVGWFEASVFFATGLPLAADFARTVAEVVDASAAEVIVATLARRHEFERVALATVASLLVDEVARDRARHLAADLLGRALTGFQAASGSTDALEVLFRAHDPEGDGEARVRRLAMTVLGGHRRRVVELGLEDLDED
ncbi:MAG: hypothetical protein RLZZ272_1747 [Actinomycetota bacterium]